MKPHFTPSKWVPTLCEYSPTNPIAEGGRALSCLGYTLRYGINEFPGPHVFLVIGQGDIHAGVQGASCGIDYSGETQRGIDPAFVTWTGCADGMETLTAGPNGLWPAPGGGLEITWTGCQRTDIDGIGVHTTIGAFYVYVYSEDVLAITPNFNSNQAPELAITGCDGSRADYLDQYSGWILEGLAARVHFGGNGSLAVSACWMVPVIPTTWGRVKTMYGSDPDSPTRPD